MPKIKTWESTECIEGNCQLHVKEPNSDIVLIVNERLKSQIMTAPSIIADARTNPEKQIERRTSRKDKHICRDMIYNQFVPNKIFVRTKTKELRSPDIIPFKTHFMINDLIKQNQINKHFTANYDTIHEERFTDITIKKIAGELTNNSLKSIVQLRDNLEKHLLLYSVNFNDLNNIDDIRKYLHNIYEFRKEFENIIQKLLYLLCLTQLFIVIFRVQHSFSLFDQQFGGNRNLPLSIV